jgi:hypothetical protein
MTMEELVPWLREHKALAAVVAKTRQHLEAANADIARIEQREAAI